MQRSEQEKLDLQTKTLLVEWKLGLFVKRISIEIQGFDKNVYISLQRCAIWHTHMLYYAFV